MSILSWDVLILADHHCLVSRSSTLCARQGYSCPHAIIQHVVICILELILSLTVHANQVH